MKKKLPEYAKRLPKRVTIIDVTYKITYNMNCGACFDCRACVITVGCSGGKENTLQSLIHEISEIIHIYLFNRFHNRGDLRFFMTHDDFDLHNNELVAALRSCGLLNSYCITAKM